jgi:hypothetical protein
MSNVLSSTLGTQQTQVPLQDVLNYQTVGMYEQHSREHHVPAPFVSAFISKSIAGLDPDLYEQKRPAEAFQWTDEPLINLQGSYTFLSDAAVIADVLTQVPALYPLLKAAIEPLRISFGDKKLLVLEALTSDESTTLRVVVKLSHNTENPAALMRNFKQEWWLKNCSQSQASLVFDYEIGNGF